MNPVNYNQCHCYSIFFWPLLSLSKSSISCFMQCSSVHIFGWHNDIQRKWGHFKHGYLWNLFEFEMICVCQHFFSCYCCCCCLSCRKQTDMFVDTFKAFTRLFAYHNIFGWKFSWAFLLAYDEYTSKWNENQYFHFTCQSDAYCGAFHIPSGILVITHFGTLVG